MTSPAHRPRFRQVVLDAVDHRALAEFYRALLGLAYRPGDEDRTDHDWLVLVNDGAPGLAFQKVDELPASTWPTTEVPQQLHLDLTVPDVEALEAGRARVLELGGTELLDRSDDEEEPLYVFADPAGHPFCIFVA